MQKPNDLNQSRIVLKQDSTLIAVIEMSLSSWLVAGIVPGVERQPLKKLAVDESALLKLLDRWREEAEKAGRRIERIAVAFEAGRDGFWLARWLRARGIEAQVIHASSVAVSREHRRAKTSRHRAPQARLSRLVARRARSLQDGGDTDYQGRRCQAAQPRAPEPRRRANSDCQPNESSVDPAGHPRLQSQAEEGCRAP